MTFGRVQIDDDKLLELYRAIVDHGAPKPGSFTALDADGRRAYFRESRRRSRDRERQAGAAGAHLPNDSTIRSALSDAALMILALDAPGAEAIREVLRRVFEARPGVPLQVEQRARAGKIVPKLIARPV